jgi:hypothetical protein
MQFTDTEVRFLLEQHRIVEHAAGVRTLNPSLNLRALGMPMEMWERVLQRRATALGRQFTEFRAANQAATTAVALTLEQQIAASKLY